MNHNHERDPDDHPPPTELSPSSSSSPPPKGSKPSPRRSQIRRAARDGDDHEDHEHDDDDAQSPGYDPVTAPAAQGQQQQQQLAAGDLAFTDDELHDAWLRCCLTRDEAAVYLHVSYHTVRYRQRKGALEPAGKLGREWVYTPEELQRTWYAMGHPGAAPTPFRSLEHRLTWFFLRAVREARTLDWHRLLGLVHELDHDLRELRYGSLPPSDPGE